IGRLDAPEREQGTTLDPEIPLDPIEQRYVGLQRLLAVDDAPIGNAPVDVLPDLFIELRLVVDLLEHGHVGLDTAHGAAPGRLRYALCKGARAKIVAPLIEAGR